MMRIAIAAAVLALAAIPAVAESYYWGEIQEGGIVWIDGFGEWGEVGFWYDDYYLDVFDVEREWLWIEEDGDVYVDGVFWGWIDPFGEVHSDRRGYLFTIEYDSAADEFFYDGVAAWDAQTVFTVLALEEKFFGWDVGLSDVLTFNQPPSVWILWDKVPDTWDEFSFRADVVDLDGTIDYLEWDFGDGYWTDEADAVHRYGRKGKYYVTLEAWDDQGGFGRDQVRIYVEYRPPTASFKRELVYSTPGKVQFYDRSLDRNGRIVNWFWDFGDGDTSREQNPDHVYRSAGTYFVSLTVTDEDGQIGVRVKKMRVPFK